jgi:hypothetical protein
MPIFFIKKAKFWEQKSIPLMKLAEDAVKKTLVTMEETKKVNTTLLLNASKLVVDTEVVIAEWVTEATKCATEEQTVDTKEHEILARRAQEKIAHLRKLCAGMATVVTMEVVMTNRVTKRRQRCKCFVSALVLTSIVAYCMM